VGEHLGGDLGNISLRAVLILWHPCNPIVNRKKMWNLFFAKVLQKVFRNQLEEYYKFTINVSPNTVQ
jgi:hypothetical protein